MEFSSRRGKNQKLKLKIDLFRRCTHISEIWSYYSSSWPFRLSNECSFISLQKQLSETIIYPKLYMSFSSGSIAYSSRSVPINAGFKCSSYPPRWRAGGWRFQISSDRDKIDNAYSTPLATWMLRETIWCRYKFYLLRISDIMQHVLSSRSFRHISVSEVNKVLEFPGN